MGTQVHLPLNFNEEGLPFFFFFADIGHCGLCFVCLGLDYQLATSNPFYLSFLPFALRNENQDSQPRCVTSTSS